MLRVGLSGGIGSGKSTVARRLAERGAFVVDSDQVAREVVAPGSAGLDQVRQRFGSEVIGEDGALDRAALATVVFADESARADLESITHPLIRQRTAQLFAAAAPTDIVVHDVPLLVEKDMGPGYHLVVVVHAPPEERLRRLTQERGMSRDAAQSRIRSQAGDEARRRAADVWLENSATPLRLQERVDDLWDGRLVPYDRNLRAGRPSRMLGEVAIVPADPAWAASADRLMARLRRAWGEDVARLDLAHIGSTAIAGLPANDVIDVQAVVDDLASLDDPGRRERLAQAGWVTAPGRWWDRAHGDDPAPQWPRRMVQGSDPAQVVHLHVRPRHSPAARRAVLFRDWMNDVATARAEYAALKAELAVRHRELEEYARAKEGWFDAAFARAEQWAADTGWDGR